MRSETSAGTSADEQAGAAQEARQAHSGQQASACDGKVRYHDTRPP